MPPEKPLCNELIDDLALTGEDVVKGGVGWVRVEPSDMMLVCDDCDFGPLAPPEEPARRVRGWRPLTPLCIGEG